MKSKICRQAWWIACISLDGLSGPWFHLHQFLRWMVSTSVILQNCWKELYMFSTYWIYVGTVFTKPAPPLWLHCILWLEFLRCSHCQKFAPEWEKLAEKAPRYPTASMESIEKIMIKTQVRCIIQDEVVAEPGETLYDEVCTAWQSAWPARTMESTCCLPPCHNQSCSWNKMIWLYSNGYGGSQTICASRTKRCVPFDLARFTVCFYLHNMLMFSCSTQTWIWRCMAKMEQPWSSLIVMGLKDKWGSLSLAAQGVKSTESTENLQL